MAETSNSNAPQREFGTDAMSTTSPISHLASDINSSISAFGGSSPLQCSALDSDDIDEYEEEFIPDLPEFHADWPLSSDSETQWIQACSNLEIAVHSTR